MVSWDSIEGEETYYCRGRPRPHYRGYIHLSSALASPLWGAYQLSLCHSAEMVAATVLSLFGTIWLFSCSGMYHTCKHSIAQEQLISKFDFIGIFMQIGFSLLPIYMVLLPRLAAWVVVGSLVLSVLAGTWLTFTDIHVSRHAMTAIYIAQGCLNLVPLATSALAPQAVFAMLQPLEVALLLAAVACYLFGSQVYAYATPQLWPATFGFHELWHLLVVLATACTWSANNSVLARAAASDHDWSGRAEESTYAARCGLWSAAAALAAIVVYAMSCKYGLREVESKRRRRSPSGSASPSRTRRTTATSAGGASPSTGTASRAAEPKVSRTPRSRSPARRARRAS